MIDDVEQQQELVQHIFDFLPTIRKLHNTRNPFLSLVHKEVEKFYLNRPNDRLMINPFQDVVFPSVNLGNIESNVYLHAIEEFVIRTYYARNRDKYKKFFDVGANVGHDSLIAAALGWQVDSFEPDPENFDQLENNIRLNGFANIRTHCKAISDTSGELKFLRVKGNLSASHIAGSRSYYGEVDKIKVHAITFTDVGLLPDLMKMNIEGHEATVLRSIPLPAWRKFDCFVALHSEEIRDSVFSHFDKTDVNIFSQKIGWEKPSVAKDCSLEKQGYIFLSMRQEMPW